MPNKVDNADIKLELWGQDYKAWESPLELVPMPNELLSQGTQRSIYKTTIPLALYDPLSAPGNNSPWVYDHFRLVINSSDFEDVIYSRIPIPTLPDLM